MTEAAARVLLRDCGGFGGLEAWIAEQEWKPAPGGDAAKIVPADQTADRQGRAEIIHRRKTQA
jgi:hypothetical protein